MTVSELISMLSAYPADTRVTLLDPDRRWLLPIEVMHLPADGSAREVDFIAITADSASDEIEGIVDGPRWPEVAGEASEVGGQPGRMTPPRARPVIVPQARSR
jgi:hypothetical protein